MTGRNHSLTQVIARQVVVHVDVHVEEEDGWYAVILHRADGSQQVLARSLSEEFAYAAAERYLTAILDGEQWALALFDVSAGALRDG